MKRARWVCCSAALWLGLALAAPAATVMLEPERIEMQVSESLEPGGLGPAWQGGTLPENWARSHPGLRGGVAWYRIEFNLPSTEYGSGSWSLYIPYLYDGGRLWLNGAPLASIAQTTAHSHVRWERPHLIAIPDSQLRTGRNQLLLRAVVTDPGAGLRLQRLTIGPSEAMLPLYERRLFWVRTMPQSTVATGLVVGAFVCFIWWRRRDEVLYGLFGLALLLWSVRTLTFVIEVLPADWWPWWRALYHSATGGFVVVLALFAMRFAGLRGRVLPALLVGYWFFGPLAMLVSMGRLDSKVGFVWTGGMIPIGLSIIGFTALAVWRQRSGEAWALLAAVVLAVAAGIHDYFVAWDGALVMPSFMQHWMVQRIFLLHHGANLLLLVMVAILTLRFVQALGETEDLNRLLGQRVAAREHELVARHAQVVQLEREQAAGEERQRIMQDLHDGLGSQLFTALSRAQRGSLGGHEVATMLEECIADMRLTFEVIAPPQADLRSSVGGFRYRWEAVLNDAGLRSTWAIELPETDPELPPALLLQVLRIAQEALTNALKHARAAVVQVRLSRSAAGLDLTIADDGQGLTHDGPPGVGCGVANMRQRAERLGAHLDLRSQPGRTVVTLHLPLARSAAGA